MSRRYKIDIGLTLNVARSLLTPDEERKIENEVLPYLFYPSLKRNEMNKKAEEFMRDIPNDYTYLRIDTCWFSKNEGKERTSVECRIERDFSAGYSEKDYAADVSAQIERLQKELPFAFEYEIKATYIERDPDLIIEGTNIPKE